MMRRVEIAGPRPPAPVVSPDDEEFWAAARDGVLILGRCSSCGLHVYPPVPSCWRCGGGDVVLRRREGETHGTVHAFTVCHRSFGVFADEVPYVLVVVELEVAPEVRMVGNLIDGEGVGTGHERVAIGDPVTMVWARYESGAVLPQWRLR